MKKYSCGHEGGVIFLNNNFLSLSAWLEWNETVGSEGTREKCWECRCKEGREKIVGSVTCDNASNASDEGTKSADNNLFPLSKGHYPSR